jgi:hypothetical protein
MRRLKLENIGPIRSADLAFGDLTVLVGPQASGKSIALQWIKLLEDLGPIQNDLDVYGIDYDRNLEKFLEVYFGEGMSALWRNDSAVADDRRGVDLKQLVRRRRPAKRDKVFLIPAQRVMALSNGWPRPFTDFSPRDPYSVRFFSEELRRLLDREFNDAGALFPRERRLKSEYREQLSSSIFGDYELKIDQESLQKRLVLAKGRAALPYMVWSAGQRELVPLLLGMYWLMPPTRIPTRGDIEWAIIEELEMGLHPRAISAVLLMVLELMTRGYRVCLSTHSPQVLEMVWAMEALRKARAGADDLLDVFDAPKTHALRRTAEAALKKRTVVYYFEAKKAVQDITGLELDGRPSAESMWGGLLAFSGRASAAVAKANANSRET